MLAAGQGLCLNMFKTGVIVTGVHDLVDDLRQTASEVGGEGVLLGTGIGFCMGNRFFGSHGHPPKFVQKRSWFVCSIEIINLTAIGFSHKGREITPVGRGGDPAVQFLAPSLLAPISGFVAHDGEVRKENYSIDPWRCGIEKVMSPQQS